MTLDTVARLLPGRPRADLRPQPLSAPPARVPGWRRIDWLLVLAALALSLTGALLVWSATRTRNLEHGGDPQAYLKRHLATLAIGVVLAAVTAAVDHRWLRAATPVVYLAGCAGLLAVLSPLGATINGAHSWFVLGSFQLQPSELAKVALVVVMAGVLGERRGRPGRPDRTAPGSRDVLAVLGLAAVPLGLILLQPDLGTAMVLVAALLGVLAVSGASSRWVGGLVLAGVVFGAAILQLHLLAPYQEKRLTQFASSSNDPRAAGYNTTQARIAIGSGGLLGKGLFRGTQTNGQFVPEQQTDFVFSVAGEELGLVGAGAIVLVTGVVLGRGLRVARRAGESGDPVGSLVAVGVVSWLAFQSFENIGMTLGVMPVTGLPLPFVSYGGSAMFANWIAVGLLVNIGRRVGDDQAL